jgi:hypothetical protein
MATILGWALDEIASAVYRNSAHGPPPEHWYPPKAVRDQLGLLDHQCFNCKGIDPSERRVTQPFCTGRRSPPKEVA